MLANEASVQFSIDDIQKIGENVPLLVNMRPHGRYHMVDLDKGAENRLGRFGNQVHRKTKREATFQIKHALYNLHMVQKQIQADTIILQRQQKETHQKNFQVDLCR